MAARKKVKQRMKLVLFGFEAVVILVMLGVLYLVMNHSSEGPKVAEMDPQVLEIHEEIRQLKEEAVGIGKASEKTAGTMEERDFGCGKEVVFIERL